MVNLNKNINDIMHTSLLNYFNYLDINESDEELEEGSLFGVFVQNIETIICDFGSLKVDECTSNFQGKIYSVNLDNEDASLENKVLLFRFLGEYYCQEYYTGDIFYLVGRKFLNIHDQRTLSYQEFYNIYLDVLEYPLCIKNIQNFNSSLIAVDDNFINIFMKQDPDEMKEKLRPLFSDMSATARKNMNDVLDKSTEIDQIRAEIENELFNYSHGIKSLKKVFPIK